MFKQPFTISSIQFTRRMHLHHRETYKKDGSCLACISNQVLQWSKSNTAGLRRILHVYVYVCVYMYIYTDTADLSFMWGRWIPCSRTDKQHYKDDMTRCSSRLETSLQPLSPFPRYKDARASPDILRRCKFPFLWHLFISFGSKRLWQSITTTPWCPNSHKHFSFQSVQQRIHRHNYEHKPANAVQENKTV